jgi:hypothetical protein
MVGLKTVIAMLAGLAIGLFVWSLRQAYRRVGRTEAVVYVIAGTVLLLPVSKVQFILYDRPLMVMVSAAGAFLATREIATKLGWLERGANP